MTVLLLIIYVHYCTGQYSVRGDLIIEFTLEVFEENFMKTVTERQHGFCMNRNHTGTLRNSHMEYSDRILSLKVHYSKKN